MRPIPLITHGIIDPGYVYVKDDPRNRAYAEARLEPIDAATTVVDNSTNWVERAINDYIERLPYMSKSMVDRRALHAAICAYFPAVDAARDVAVQVDEGAAELLAAIETIINDCDNMMGEWSYVSYPYIPSEYEGLYRLRDTAHAAIKAHKARLAALPTHISQLREGEPDDN